MRGNPWEWDTAVVDDDWPYVLFDWDTHFAAYALSLALSHHLPPSLHFIRPLPLPPTSPSPCRYMLSLDAKELAYSTLIAIVKAKSAEGFVPNGWALPRYPLISADKHTLFLYTLDQHTPFLFHTPLMHTFAWSHPQLGIDAQVDALTAACGLQGALGALWALWRHVACRTAV